MPALSKKVKTQTKKLGKHAAKQVIGEPLEILKTAANQATGQEKTPLPQDKIISSKKHTESFSHPDEQKINLKSQRLLEANQKELEDIRKEKVFKELQEKISQGEDVPVENYEELSMEQKQVLNAQKQAVKERNNMQSEETPFIEPTTKRKRNIIAGMEGKLDRMKRKREIRTPPSG